MKNMLEAVLWTISRTDEGNTVLLRLRETDLIIPLFMDDTEVRALIQATEPLEEPERPSTQDLLMDFAVKSGFCLIRAELYALKDDLFHARLVFAGGIFPETAPLALEALPSDAITLAIRARRPILVTPDLADETGIPEDLMLEELDEEAL